MTQILSHSPRTSGIAGKVRSLGLALMLAVGGAAAAASAAQPVAEVNVNDGYAVHGYDVVAYFTAGQPAEGDDRYTAEYEGAQYRFASAEHRDTFKQDPAKYAPQYGGFCAFAVALGKKLDGDPRYADLARTLSACRNDEVAHRDEARGLVHGEQGAMMRVWTWLVGAGSAAGVAVARRL